MIKAEIVLDSKSAISDDRITTMKVTFPRFILAELNTHRMFSRNSASSRAIPTKTMLKMVMENPFIPIAWQKDHKGMQGTEYFTLEKDASLNLSADWYGARNAALLVAKEMNTKGVTKQLVNRLLEPFMWTTVLVTATEWENFFALRCPQYEVYAGPEDTNECLCKGRSWKDFMKSNNGLAGDFNTTDVIERLKLNKGQAEIHMMALAEAMWDAYTGSTPQMLAPGEWHIPYSDDILIPGDRGIEFNTHETLKIASARCARVSYTVVGQEGKKLSFEKEIDTFNKLITRPYTALDGTVFSKDDPIHPSPLEHCAQCMTQDEYNMNICGEMVMDKQDDIVIYDVQNTDVLGWKGNFRGFIQYRKFFPNENITKR